MDNTVKGSLILDGDQSGDTLLSPGCTLILKYEGRDKVPIDSSSPDARVPSRTREDICRETVSALEKIPGMSESDVRLSLIQTGFRQCERNRFDSNVDMHADYVNMVGFAVSLGKLDVLIKNAKTQPQDPLNRSKLEEYRRIYCDEFKFKDYKSPPLPSKDEA